MTRILPESRRKPAQSRSGSTQEPQAGAGKRGSQANRLASGHSLKLRCRAIFDTGLVTAPG